MPQKINTRIITKSALETRLLKRGEGVLGLTVDNGAQAITAGLKGFVYVPRACTITKLVLLSSDPTAIVGSIAFDIWKDVFASYPPTVGDSITGGAYPALVSQNKAAITSFGAWTTLDLAEGDVLAFNVNSASAVTRVGCFLHVQW